MGPPFPSGLQDFDPGPGFPKITGAFVPTLPGRSATLTAHTIVFAPMLRQAYPAWVVKSKYTDLERKRARDYRGRAEKYRASATKAKKLTDRPALVQLAP
jgi:hypothetical protein